MKTTVFALGVLLALSTACTAAVGGTDPQPTENTDPNAFLQPGGNSYSAPANGVVVVVATVQHDLQGKPSAGGTCLVDQSLPQNGSMLFDAHGKVYEAPVGAVGTWKQTGTSGELCLYGICQTCSAEMGSTTCSVSCPNALTVAETYYGAELIPFTFNCVDNVCTTLGGASVNADGTLTYGGVVLATWKGTHVEAQICFGNHSCYLFHPTP